MTTAPHDSMRIGDALTQYYRVHALPPDGGASGAWFRVHIGPLTLPLPNLPARRRALFFHDVNHIATGYDTTFSRGEMAIAGFEVGAGCGRFGAAWFLNLTMLALGLLARPRAVFGAFVRGRRSASIYHLRLAPAALSAMSVADVRALLRLDEERGAVRPADRVRFAAWATVAFLVLLGPPFLILTALRTAFRSW